MEGLALVHVTSEMFASARHIMMCPCLESLFHVLNIFEDLSWRLYLLGTYFHGALIVLIVSLAASKFLMRVHVIEELLVVTTGLLAICPTLIEIVK